MAATITATAGNNQSATIITNFATLQATVLDTGGNPVVGAVVNFSAPTTGARATFSGAATASGTTDALGKVTAPVALAGTVAGGFSITATVQGTAPAVATTFNLTSTVGAPATITRVSGTGQSVALGADFAQPLVAVVKDAGGNVLPNVSVTFNAPTTGARATFLGAAFATVTTDSSGQATSPAVTSASATGRFTVSAKVNNTTPPAAANFTLSNTPAVPGSVGLQSGSAQTTVVNTNFGLTLQAKVLDTQGKPVGAGVTVTFTLPNTGASGTFGVLLTATATTNASGIAISPTLKANTVAGTFFAQAAISLTATTNYTLTNLPDTPVGISIVSGDPQSTIVSTPFSAPLVALVKDVYGNPVPLANVTFLAPTAGSVASFPGPTNTVSVTTDSAGKATSPTLTANATAGSYTITASIASGTFVNFNLKNTPAPANITVTNGSPQTTPISTPFVNPLTVTVTDTNKFPVPGVTVTFTLPVAAGANATLSSTTATTDASGVASVNATANPTAGSYVVTAKVTGLATQLSFNLTNTAGAPASISINNGSPQTTPVSTQFGAPLRVTVKDCSNNPVPNIAVTFTLPVSSGANATLSSSTATTDATGVASVTATANAMAGSYIVTAKVTGIATQLSFNLTNTGTPGLQLVVTASPTNISGPGQTVVFSYTVTNTGNVPILGLNITDAKVIGVTCPAKTLALNASMICTANYVSIPSDVTGAAGITSVAKATSTTTVGAAFSATVTTKVGVDADVIRKKTVDANKGLLQNRAQTLTSMSPNAQRLHHRLTAWLFGSADESDADTTETGRHEPLKAFESPQDGGGAGNGTSSYGGLKGTSVPGLPQPSSLGNGVRGSAGTPFSTERDAMQADGSRASAAAPFMCKRASRPTPVPAQARFA